MSWLILKADAQQMPIASNSIDDIITDPPYGLEFMGKEWDHGVPGVDFWHEALRVLKPGGHLLAFGGTRTFHRLTCAIEDAGFEIRDSLGWNHMEHIFCQCEAKRGMVGLSEKESSVRVEVSNVRSAVPSSAVTPTQEQESLLLSVVPKQDIREATARDSETRTSRMDAGEQEVVLEKDERSIESGVEGRRNAVQKEGQLQEHSIRESAGSLAADGSEGRLHHGAPDDNGGMVRQVAIESGSGEPRESRSNDERQIESDSLANEQGPQIVGGWPCCRGCGKSLAPPLFQGPLAWNYGSGFPKSLDVSKAIDKAAGAERKQIGYDATRARPNRTGRVMGEKEYDRSDNGATITAPATDAAKEWQGWGTALKPAWEPIIIARKPIEKNVAHNVQKYGTGAINIDACRIAAGVEYQETARIHDHSFGGDSVFPSDKSKPGFQPSSGRWPANVILSHHPECEQIGTKKVKGDGREFQGGKRESGFYDVGDKTGDGKPAGPLYGDSEIESWRCHADCPVRLLDEQSGELTSGTLSGSFKGGGPNCYGEYGMAQKDYKSNSGGASRFFYTAKASKSDRGAGNHHPTVKPQDLMEYLIKLVSRPGSIILDPFAGSGTTIFVADKLGRHAIGLDKEPEYIEIGRRRIIDDAPLFNL